MKNSKIINGTKFLSIILATAFLTTSAFAFQGNSNSENTKQNFQTKSQHYEIIEDTPYTELTAAEIDMLIYGQQEERLARDVYAFLAKKYDLKIFANISQSENQHMEAIGLLLEKYGIDQTTGYGELQSLYDELITQGSLSLKDALEVGIAIEILDISDLDESLSETSNADIELVFNNLRNGSLNHLSAFVRNLQKQDYETDLNWEQYINQDDLGSTGISQKGIKNGNNTNSQNGQKGKRFNQRNS